MANKSKLNSTTDVPNKESIFLDRLFTMTEVTSNIYSAVAAVLALHLALALYIYQAYFGTTTTEKTKRN
uniref:Uncharacterized protein n=1 Tax=Glossina morsitans morsitans TaxID=37546 RepID=A0A1B0FHK4_GLOMM